MDENVIKLAKSILAEANGKICNHCLGRKLSSSFDGNDNVDRALTISEELNIDQSASECVICGNLFDKIDDSLFDKVYDKLDSLDVEFDSFLVGTSIDKKITEKDNEFSEKLGLEVETIKKELNRVIGRELEKSLGREVRFDKQDIVVNVDLRRSPKIRIQINPIFIEGKYNKFKRGIPQTKWPCTHCKGRGCEACNFTGKQYSESVEELLSEHILEVTRGYQAKFHGAGREDLDVLMLGEGRPFILEIKEPRIRKIDLPYLEEKINKINEGKTKYNNLTFAERNRKAEIKVSSPDTFKVYKAIVKTESEYNADDLDKLTSLDEIHQQTPVRVLRRRADKVRIRHIKDLKTEVIDSTTFEMTIKTEGGLYIKELISGDDGRSQPNISDILGIPAVCEQLDVIQVSDK